MWMLIASLVLLALMLATAIVTGSWWLFAVAVVVIVGVNVWLNFDDVMGLLQR